MSQPLLSHGSLARVLQSLLRWELKACRGGSAQHLDDLPDCWPEDLAISAGGLALEADSLEVLRLGAAVNEMFHLHENRAEPRLRAGNSFGAWLRIIEESWREGVSRITFSTSGSTGAPKRCTHENTYLAMEIDTLATLFADRSRIVSHVPAHHIYGFLFTAMLADRLGVEVASGAPLHASEPVALLGAGDLVVGVPEQWQAMDRSTPRWPDGVEGVVSTGPCPSGLIASLISRGLGGMTEVYGSSETAGVATRRWPEEGYRLMPHWRVERAEEAPVLLTHVLGACMPVMDRLLPRDAETFVLDGRRDQAVQVGGINVFPERVASVLRSGKGVADAAVRMMRPEEGMRLKAFVVPCPGASPDEVRRALYAWAKQNLPPAERPMSITFGLSLPVGETGKPCDW